MHPSKRVCVGTLPERTAVLREITSGSLNPGVLSTRSSSMVSQGNIKGLVIPRSNSWEENVEQMEVSLALNNVVVLDKIFEFLNVKDLKICRLVCSKWADAGTLALVKGRVCVSNSTLVRHTLFVGAGKTETQNDENAEPVGLHMPVMMPLSVRVAMNFIELKDSVGFSRRFPAVGINLTNQTWRLSHKVVKQFLRLHGAKMKFLNLNFNFQRARALSDLLQKHLPNLEEIHMTYVGNFRRDQIGVQLLGCLQQPLELPALKIISLKPKMGLPIGQFSKAVCEELILAAKNLEQIKEFHPCLTRAVIRANKIHTVSSFRFIPFAADVEHLREFAQAKPKLRRIEILEMFPMADSTSQAMQIASQALSGILESSKKVLEFLKTSPLQLLTGARFPMLLNLTTLVVAFDNRLCRSFGTLPVEQHLNFFGIFPDHVSISHSFPRLRKVRLELINWNDRNAFTFPASIPRDVVPSVEVLEYSCSFDMRGMTILHSCFPNVNHLVINWPQCFSHGDYRAIWRVPFRLKRLEIYSMSFIWDKGPSAGNAMDSFFTGIPEGICQNLRTTNWTHFTNPSVLRTEPSLVCFNDMTELKISFSYEGLLGLRLLGKCPLISEVTGLFAFQIIPSLKVLIVFDYNHPLHQEMVAALRPLAPFATFVHSPSESF